MAAPKGTMPPAAGMGRPKGCKNKLSRNAVDAIWGAYEHLQKTDNNLQAWAKANPDEFYSKVFIKVIPKNVTVSGGIEFSFKGFSRVSDPSTDPL
jgi:hypothetical protein